MALNNMDVISECALILHQEIEEQCAEIFPALADRESVKSCLSELGEMSNNFKKTLECWNGATCSNCDPESIQYLIVYAYNEVNDLWVHAVETNISSAINDCQQL